MTYNVQEIEFYRKKIMQRYLELIQDERLKAFVNKVFTYPEVLESLAKPSTYNGHNHPNDEFVQNGLALHSLRVCNLALNLYRSTPEPKPLEQDLIIVGSLLHDVPHKYLGSGFPNHNHAVDNCSWFLEVSESLDNELRKEIGSIILNHMGKWNTSYSELFNQYPITTLSWIVHLADSISARRNVLVDVSDVDYLKENLA